jgi:hypothetical protein
VFAEWSRRACQLKSEAVYNQNSLLLMVVDGKIIPMQFSISIFPLGNQNIHIYAHPRSA